MHNNQHNQRYVIALDQGTSSSRAILFDESATMVAIAQQAFQQHYPQTGWVEHDPLEIWQTQEQVLQQVIQDAAIEPTQVSAIGITNQRETTVVWNRQTGEPIYHAIVWQDKRTADICQQLQSRGLQSLVLDKTGLLIDAYFSATKIQWILEQVEGARELAEKGVLAFGTIDTWLLWKLTNGQHHATDYSNASRTLLFNSETLDWDAELLELFAVPKSMLPTVQDSASHFGDYGLGDVKIPIMSMIGDQQAALFGQLCVEPGDVKNTYGTGCFMLLNTGEKRQLSQQGLLSTIAWGLNGNVTYALEGSVYIAGAAIQWLRDGLEIIEHARDTEHLAMTTSSDDVVVVPAFVGLGAPHWDMYAKGAIFGLDRSTGKAEIAKATLQSLAFQSYDVLRAMQDDSGLAFSVMKVDGGAIANDYLAQFQADILRCAIERPQVIESTATGAAYLAGIAGGIWTLDDLKQRRQVDQTFSATMPMSQQQRLLTRWNKAVSRTKGWLQDENE